MRRRISEGRKRYIRRRNKLFLKGLIKLMVPITASTVFLACIFNKLKDFGIFGSNDDYKKYISKSVEETISTFEYEELNKDIEADLETINIETEIIPEVLISEEMAPEIIPEEPIPEETIGTDLLDMGYKFEQIDFEKLLSDNQDAVGWIYIDNTNVDYAIVQGSDNDYYAKHDLYGNDSKSACIYLDANNNSFETPMYDLNDLSFIYGHYIKDGKKMFATIHKYKKQTFYEENPFFVIYTPEGYAFKADVFAGIIVSGKDGFVYSDNYDYNFSDQEEFDNYMEYLKENSLISSDLSVEYGDKIVALVTCTYENENSRFIVYARLSKQYTNQLQKEEGAHLGLKIKGERNNEY